MKLTRVTQVLERYHDWSNVPEARLLNARDRGILVDRACMAIARGCWAVCNEEVEPYVISFKRWVESAVEKIHAIQPELIDKDLGLIGHPDLIVTFKGNSYATVTDVKTPLILQKLWRLQIAPYCHLAIKGGYPVKEGGSLRLSPKGKIARFDESKDWRQDLVVFFSMLNVHRFMDGN